MCNIIFIMIQQKQSNKQIHWSKHNFYCDCSVKMWEKRLNISRHNKSWIRIWYHIVELQYCYIPLSCYTAAHSNPQTHVSGLLWQIGKLSLYAPGLHEGGTAPDICRGGRCREYSGFSKKNSACFKTLSNDCHELNFCCEHFDSVKIYILR